MTKIKFYTLLSFNYEEHLNNKVIMQVKLYLLMQQPFFLTRNKLMTYSSIFQYKFFLEIFVIRKIFKIVIEYVMGFILL